MWPQRVAHMLWGGVSCTGSRQMLHTMHAGVDAAAVSPVLLLLSAAISSAQKTTSMKKKKGACFFVFEMHGIQEQ